MKYLKISNDGLLDTRLIYLMGGTTKANDDYKIGQFGTGLKYTLAYLLRNNLVFHIYVGGREVEIHSVTEVIRDTEFEVIYIDGQKTSITTMVGREWEAWMIVREIYCNALDEPNGTVQITERVEPEIHSTEFYIQLAGDIKDVWENWSRYFIHGAKVIQDTDKFALYPGGEGLRFYKKGVLIYWDKKSRGVFSYDLKDARINELREFNGVASMEIAYILPLLSPEAVEYFLNGLEGSFEDSMDYNWGYEKYGKGWEDALGDAKIINYESYEKLAAIHPEITEQPLVKLPKGLFTKLIEQFPGISMLRASKNTEGFLPVEDATFRGKIIAALETLTDCGYYMAEGLTILTGEFGASRKLAQINMDTKEIHLSMQLAGLPITDIMKALIEENEHYITKFYDCSREFQNHFIGLFLNQLTKAAK